MLVLDKCLLLSPKHNAAIQCCKAFYLESNGSCFTVISAGYEQYFDGGNLERKQSKIADRIRDEHHQPASIANCYFHEKNKPLAAPK
jgi:hypothetical protein